MSRRGFLRWLSFSGAGVAASTLLADPAGASAPDLTVFVNGRLIDGTGAPTRSDAVIVVARDKIVAVAQGRGVPRPAGARTVDLAGRYVIPGLWDMHAHNIVDEAIFPPLYLANGVTGIREMRGGPEVRATRARIERGELLGPRVVAAGQIVDGPATFLGPEDIIVHDRREVIATVRQIKRDGGDFVKVYSHLTPELYQDVADATRREHIPFAGHIPYLVPAEDVSRAGQHTVEHLLGIPVAVSGQRDAFNALIAQTPLVDPFAYYYFMRELDWQASESYDPARAAAFYRLLIRNRTWQVPTITVLRMVNSPLGTFDNDPRLVYIPEAYRQPWAERHAIFAPTTPEQIVVQARFLDALIAIVGAMEAAGVPLVAGTDCSNPFVLPGFSLHDELANLVGAGLSPMRALQAATRDAARCLGIDHQHGTVTPGKAADFVVLDADPLADITNTTRIHAVVARGRHITSADRERMLADVRAAAESPSPTTLAAATAGCACHAPRR
ncbi:amidohydrolase family protein [Luedemannella flava]|uniref:amidohydrolase family protein n=1 Tax=Luedemannella flava TaxID=349316 RepID=UPI0031E41553